MLSVLNETQRAIIETTTMRLHVPQALEYLKDSGHEMSRATYFRQKKKVERMKLDRMHYIAKYFPDQHLERIDRCELVEKLCWENYHAEKDPTKKVKILESIISIQPYLSGYYESTKIVLESTVANEKENRENEKPSFDDWFRKYSHMPLIGNETDEELGKYYRDLQNEYNDYLKDLNWHNGFVEGPDPCKKREVESSEWAKEEEKPDPLVTIPNTNTEPEPRLVTTLSTQEAAPVVETVAEEPKQEPEPEPKQKDTIDLDIAGRYPMPIDYEFSWIQCEFEGCSKWFKTKELRSKHVIKYHT